MGHGWDRVRTAGKVCPKRVPACPNVSQSVLGVKSVKKCQKVTKSVTNDRTNVFLNHNLLVVLWCGAAQATSRKNGGKNRIRYRWSQPVVGVKSVKKCQKVTKSVKNDRNNVWDKLGPGWDKFRAAKKGGPKRVPAGPNWS